MAEDKRKKVAAATRKKEAEAQAKLEKVAAAKRKREEKEIAKLQNLVEEFKEQNRFLERKGEALHVL